MIPWFNPDAAIGVAALAWLVPPALFALALRPKPRSLSVLNPATRMEPVLRSPGHTLERHVEGVQWRGIRWMVMTSTGCALAAAAVGWAAPRLLAGFAWTHLLVLAACPVPGLILAGYAGRRAYRLFRQAAVMRFMLRGEQAVAEALHLAGDGGYRVFHDVPVDSSHSNASHIVVGPSGVFLVQTHMRLHGSMVASGQVVKVSQKVLRFPGIMDNQAVPAADIAAQKLAVALSRQTDQPVEVTALVVLPGWFIETEPATPVVAVRSRKRPEPARKTRAGVPSGPSIAPTVVLNSLGLPGYLREQRRRKISPAQLAGIVASLEKSCRNVLLGVEP